MRKVMRRPEFRWLFAGMTFSMIAESILLLALAVWVKTLTGSDGMAGATIFAVVAPMTLAPFVGYFVDRFPRKPFLVSALLASAVLLTPLFLVHERDDVWIIYAVSVGYGLSYISVSSALNALIKETIPEDLLAEANGALQTVRQGLRLIAPLVGATLYVATKGWGLALAGIGCFLLAALVTSFLTVPRKPAPAMEMHWLREVGAGVSHIVRTPALRRMTIGVTAALIMFGMSESASFALVDKGLHRPPEFLAWFLSLQGIGGIIGGLTAAKVVAKIGEIATAALGLALFLPLTVAALWPQLWVLLATSLIAGIGLPYIIVGLMTLMQRLTPHEILGRASSAMDAMLSGPQALSIGLGAVLVGLVSFKTLFAIMAVVVGLSALYLFAARGLSPRRPAGDEAIGDAAAVREPEVV